MLSKYHLSNRSIPLPITRGRLHASLAAIFVFINYNQGKLDACRRKLTSGAAVGCFRRASDMAIVIIGAIFATTAYDRLVLGTHKWLTFHTRIWHHCNTDYLYWSMVFPELEKAANKASDATLVKKAHQDTLIRSPALLKNCWHCPSCRGTQIHDIDDSPYRNNISALIVAPPLRLAADHTDSHLKCLFCFSTYSWDFIL